MGSICGREARGSATCVSSPQRVLADGCGLVVVFGGVLTVVREKLRDVLRSGGAQRWASGVPSSEDATCVTARLQHEPASLGSVKQQRRQDILLSVHCNRTCPRQRRRVGMVDTIMIPLTLTLRPCDPKSVGKSIF